MSLKSENLIFQLHVFEEKLQNLVERYYDLCFNENYYSGEVDGNENKNKNKNKNSDLIKIEEVKSIRTFSSSGDSVEKWEKCVDYFHNDYNDNNMDDDKKNDFNDDEDNIINDDDDDNNNDNSDDDDDDNYNNNEENSNKRKISHLCHFLINRLEHNENPKSIDSDFFLIRQDDTKLFILYNHIHFRFPVFYF